MLTIIYQDGIYIDTKRISLCFLCFLCFLFFVVLWKYENDKNEGSLLSVIAACISLICVILIAVNIFAFFFSITKSTPKNITDAEKFNYQIYTKYNVCLFNRESEYLLNKTMQKAKNKENFVYKTNDGTILIFTFQKERSINKIDCTKECQYNVKISKEKSYNDR